MSAAGLGDILDQGTFTEADSTSHNYLYDKKGRLIRDLKHGIDSIQWTAYDKVKAVIRVDTSSKPGMTFTYNANQQRLTKSVIYKDLPANNFTLVYVYGASGVLMATYNQTATELRLNEFETYGLSRLGSYKVDEVLTASVAAASNVAASLRFEISDRIGSVRAIVGGIKNGDGSAMIYSLSDFYEFGMHMSGRSFSSESSRLGYQGKELDDETNTYDFGERGFDPRVGRWFKVDPYTAKYAGESPYSGMANSPLIIGDSDGRDIYFLGNWSPEAKASYETAMEKTTWGKAIKNKYGNSKTDDIYIVASTSITSHTGAKHSAVTFKDVPSVRWKGSGVSIQNGYWGPYIKSNEKNGYGFINEYIDHEKRIHYVVIDAKDIKDKYDGAFKIIHEIMSHIWLSDALEKYEIYEGESPAATRLRGKIDHIAFGDPVGQAANFDSPVNRFTPSSIADVTFKELYKLKNGSGSLGDINKEIQSGVQNAVKGSMNSIKDASKTKGQGSSPGSNIKSSVGGR